MNTSKKVIAHDLCHGTTHALGSPRDTALLRRMLGEQHEKGVTPGDIGKSALTTLAVALLSTVGYLVFVLFVGQLLRSVAWLFWIIILGGPLFIIYMFIQFFVLLAKLLLPRIHVACPFCSTQHTLLKSTPYFCCPSCRRVIFPHGDSPLSAVRCPMCEVPFGAGRNVDQIRCGNCGSHLKIADGVPGVGSTVPCTACGAPLAMGAYGCRKCQSLVLPPDAALIRTDTPAKYMGEKSGLLFYTRGILAWASSELDKDPPDGQHPEWYYGKLEHLNEVMKTLLDAELLSVDESLPSVVRVAHEIDSVYAKCLWRTSLEFAKNTTTAYGSDITGLFGEGPSHIVLRDQLSAGLTEACSRISRPLDPAAHVQWKRPLLTKEAADGQPDIQAVLDNTTWKYAVRNPRPLHHEAFRLAPGVVPDPHRVDNVPEEQEVMGHGA